MPNDVTPPAAPATTTATTPVAATPPAAAAPPAATPAAPAASGEGATSIAAQPAPGAETKPAEPPAVALDDAKKYLTEKGVKADDLAKLDEAAIRAKYDEQKAADAKAAEAKANDFEVKAPEGLILDEKQVADFKALLTDDKTPLAERGQKLIDMHAAALKAQAEASNTLWRDTQAKWQGEVKADGEIGGQNYDAMRARIAKAIDEIGGKEAPKMREAFDFTGAGNNPEIIRLLDRMAKAVTEGGPVAGGAPAAAGDATKKALAAMYPTAAAGQS